MPLLHLSKKILSVFERMRQFTGGFLLHSAPRAASRALRFALSGSRALKEAKSLSCSDSDFDIS